MCLKSKYFGYEMESKCVLRTIISISTDWIFIQAVIVDYIVSPVSTSPIRPIILPMRENMFLKIQTIEHKTGKTLWYNLSLKLNFT